MPQPGHVPLPDGESVDIVYVAKGEQPPAAPLPDVPNPEGSVRIEHTECDDKVQSISITYAVAGVERDDDVASLVEEVPHHESKGGCTCQLPEPLATVVGMFNSTKNHLRRFVLQRDRDDTGVSGTGVVAEGVVLTDGRVVLRWLGERSSIVMWDDLSNVMAVHGHSGATRLRWLDTPDPDVAPHPDAGSGVAQATSG